MVASYRRNPKIEESPLQHELMLFDPVDSRFFVLNRTMAYVWRNCDGERTVEMFVQGLPREFAGVGDRDLASEVRAALHELVGLGLVTAV